MTTTVCKWLERDLFPFADTLHWNHGEIEEGTHSLIDKVHHYSTNFFKFLAHLAILPIACVYSIGKYVISWIQGGEKEIENLPSNPENPQNTLPDHFGFSTSMFQDSGLGTKFSATPLDGVCDWDEWLNPKRIEGEDTNYRRFFFDILNNPDSYIDILKKQHVTAHRFSLEWAVIELEPGKPNGKAIALYENFINKLKEAGIEPYVTLHHFVCPKWFKDRGGFEKRENIEAFKKHAIAAIKYFQQVSHWIPFNEINVDAFQKCIRGVYPPGDTGDIAKAGRMMRNMLIAHCQIYQEAKKRWPEKQIGSTHQWLNFEPLTGNLLEETICYFLSKVTHYACYNFFKTGKFSLEIPALSNVQFEISEEEFKKHRGFSDFIGVQFYGYPRLKAGFNGGEKYPGFGIKNYTIPSLGLGLTFGSTCPQGGIAQSFGPGVYPESLDKCLKEATEIVQPFKGKTIVITETGCDARVWKFGDKGWTVDFEVQKQYFEKIFPILEKFKKHISGFFAWTLAHGLEWERGATPILNVGRIMKNNKGQIESYVPYPAAVLLREIFAKKVTGKERVA